MHRHYDREAAWAKKKYYQISVRITPEEHDKLKAILRRIDKTLVAWLRDKISEDERA